MIHIATGLARRDDGAVLLVASTYANHPEPLWTLPGGRQRPGELLAATVAREFAEETGLTATVGELAYLSESYDGDVHVLNATFLVDAGAGDPQSPAERGLTDHAVAVEWVARGDLAARLAVAVVREPLLAYLDGTLAARYAGYARAGITIRWPSGSA